MRALKRFRTRRIVTPPSMYLMSAYISATRRLVPVLGEFTDVAFAPFEAGLVFFLFKSGFLGGLGFIEEILPFTDVIPTFTIGWCLQNLWPTTPAARALGISK